MKKRTYLKAMVAWTWWLIFHRREMRRLAESAVRERDRAAGRKFDLHDLSTQARIYAVQLDLEEEKWRQFMEEKL